MPPATSFPIYAHRPPTESFHHRLIDIVKIALIKLFVSPYATVCELYCGKVPDEEKWDEAQIGHYIGIDVATSGMNEKKEAWESQRKVYTTELIEIDPCTEDLKTQLQDKDNQADIVFCMHNLQLCFESEEKARKLLHNVSSLLKPGGYFLGITTDSSTIWAKYQKNVEAYHNKGSGMKPNIVPNCIRSESYTIAFEVEEEKFPFFGKKYQLKFANDISAETQCLVHFPSLIRLAREAGLDYIEIQNLTDFYDDYRPQFVGMLQDVNHNLIDPRGRLLPRAYDVLGLFTTFVFRKPDPDIAPPLMTPFIVRRNNDDEASEYNSTKHILQMIPMDSQGIVWRDDEKNGQVDSSQGLGKITEQKGILGPGPAELRFPEAL
nr:mRNA cap guanine-N7 methyltransferase 2 isoform X1 [Ipomoea batatas]